MDAVREGKSTLLSVGDVADVISRRNEKLSRVRESVFLVRVFEGQNEVTDMCYNTSCTWRSVEVRARVEESGCVKGCLDSSRGDAWKRVELSRYFTGRKLQQTFEAAIQKKKNPLI